MEKYFWIPVALTLIVFPLGPIAQLHISPDIRLHLLDLAVGLNIPLAIYLLWGRVIARTLSRFGLSLTVEDLSKGTKQSQSRSPRPSLALRTRDDNFLPTFAKPFLLFVTILHVSLLFNLNNLTLVQAVTSYLYIARLLGYSSLFIVTLYLICPGHPERAKRVEGSSEAIKSYFLLAIQATAILGLIQYIIFPDLRPLAQFGWDPHLYRSVGTFMDPGFFGLILVFGLNYWLITRRLQLSPQFFLFYVPLSLTYSRASYLAFLVSIFCLSAIKRSWRFLVNLLLIFALTLIILPRLESIGTKLEREDTIKARIENWGHTIQIFKDHPIFGVGFNTYRYAQTKYGFLPDLNSHAGAGADSSILFTFATSGIFGGLALIYFLFSLLKFLRRHQLYVTFCSLAALLVHSFFLNSIYYPWVIICIIFSTVIELNPHQNDK